MGIAADALTNEALGLKEARPLSQNLLRYNRRERLQEQKAQHESQLRDPFQTDKGAQVKAIRQIDKTLATQAPKPSLPDAERDKLAKVERALREDLRQGMPSIEQMRRCGPGDLHAHQQWEAGNKDKILRWKNVRVQLEPNSNDKDLANIEIFRPEKGTARFSGLQMDAMGPQGHMGYQNVPDENWNAAFDPGKKVPTALDGARKVAVERRVDETKNGKPKKRGTMSAAARHAASERMKAKWADRRAAQMN